MLRKDDLDNRKLEAILALTTKEVRLVVGQTDEANREYALGILLGTVDILRSIVVEQLEPR